MVAEQFDLLLKPSVIYTLLISLPSVIPLMILFVSHMRKTFLIPGVSNSILAN